MLRRTILRTIYVAYAVAIAALLLLPRAWFPDFYNPGFMAGISTLAILLIVSFGWIFNPQGDEERIKIIEKTQLAAAVALFANGLGGLGAYKLYLFGLPYDKALHFMSPGIFVAGISYFLYEWYKIKLQRSVIIALIITIAFSFFWEAIEVIMDTIFKTETAGNYGADYWKDTAQDIIADLIGAFVAGYLVFRERFK